MIPRAWGITAVNVGSRAAHLLVFLAIGNLYGATSATDALFVLQVPLVVLAAIMVQAAELVVMPAVHRAEARGGVAVMVATLLRNALAVVMPLSALLLAVAAWWSGVFSPLLLGLFLPIPVFATFGAIASGLLHARGEHARASLGPVYGALAAGLLLVLTPPTIVSLAAVLLGFEVGRAAGLFADARRHLHGGGGSLPEDLTLWPGRKAVLNVVASAVVSLNLLVDVAFASRLPTGSVTLVEYASRLWNAVPLLFSGHLILVYARFSRASADQRWRARDLYRPAALLGLAGLALSALAIALAPWGVELVYGAGRLGAGERQLLASLLRTYLLGAGPFLVGVVFVRGLAASGRPEDLARIALVSVVVNATCNALLVGPFGVLGIGLSTSLTYTFNAVVLALWSRRW